MLTSFLFVPVCKTSSNFLLYCYCYLSSSYWDHTYSSCLSCSGWPVSTKAMGFTIKCKTLKLSIYKFPDSNIFVLNYSEECKLNFYVDDIKAPFRHNITYLFTNMLNIFHAIAINLYCFNAIFKIKYFFTCVNKT